MPSIFDFSSNDAVDPKMHVSQGSLPPYIDADQPPTKRSPWRQIQGLSFVHTLTMLMPDEMYEIIWNALDAEVKKTKYAKVIMKLQEVLEGDFFTEYIKKGDILMLSEGCAGVDNIFSLRDGVLRLDVDKESYERAGLQGRPIRSGGRKHVKARYLIEIDLRQPSMLHGKKGFERIVWAAKNVLNQSRVWLFKDVCKSTPPPASTLPLDKYHPTCLELAPSMRIHQDVVVHHTLHDLTVDSRGLQADEDEDDYYELLEWIDSVSLGSAEVSGQQNTGGPGVTATTTTIREVKFQGLLGSEQVLQILISVMFSRTSKSSSWLVVTATGHRPPAWNHIDGFTIVLTPPQLSDQHKHPITDTSPALGQSKMKKKWQNNGLQHFLVLEMSDTLAGP